MSAVLSVLNRNGETVDPQLLETMLAASPDRAVDGQDIRLDGNVALAHQHFWMTPEELGERQPLNDAAGRWTITADARIDNRSELIRRLGLGENEMSDAQLILQAYQRWGTACVENLRGDFAFVIWDKDEQLLFAARDALGVHGLCYYVDHKLCMIGSEVSQLLAHPAVSPQVNENKIAEYLAGLMQNHEDTFYENIYYCPPAHCFLVGAESFRLWRYWDVDPQVRIRYKDDREYSENFLELLTEAVRCRLRTIGPVGISMSGGLDSTIVTAIASQLLPETRLPQKRLKSFSYIFDELTSCDERRYIQPMVDRYQLDATFIPGDDKWTLRDIENWPHIEEYVMSDAFAWLPHAVMDAAQEKGCRLLLAGYYGDSLVLGGRYWAAGMMADMKFDRLAKMIMRHRSLVNFREDLLVNGVRFMVPQRLRMLYRNLQSHRVTTGHAGLHPRLAERAQLGSKLYADPQKRADFGPDQWHRYLGLTLNIWDQSFSVVRSFYNKHGLELSIPYWDRTLVEFVMAIPADQLGHPQRERRLQRNAAANLLPDVVRERRQTTTLEPLLEKGLLVEENATVKRIMHDPLIVEQQYVNADWLREHLNGGLGWSDKEHNYFLWLCLSLELWLRKINLPAVQAASWRIV